MSDPPRPDEPDSLPTPEAECSPSQVDQPPEVSSEVALIMAASDYEVIDTLEAPASPGVTSPIEEFEESPAPDAPAGESLAPVLEAIGDLGGRIDRLQAVVDRELRAESSREKVVDRLHAELQEYKNDLLLKITKPIFIDLIQLHDDLGKMAEALSDDQAVKLLQDVRQGIEDVLYRQGVEPFTTEDSTFDPRRQRALSTVSTEDPDQNKRIAARLRPGFAIDEKVIRPELVSVYSWKRPTPDGPQDEPGEA